jgi:hypothetical protein
MQKPGGDAAPPVQASLALAGAIVAGTSPILRAFDAAAGAAVSTEA